MQHSGGFGGAKRGGGGFRKNEKFDGAMASGHQMHRGVDAGPQSYGGAQKFKNRKPQQRKDSDGYDGVQNPKQKWSSADKGDGHQKTNYSNLVVTDEIRLFVTQVDGPLQFWAQTVVDDLNDQLMSIGTELATACTELVVDPQQYKVCGTIFSEDGEWYRCKILKDMPGGKVKVSYIDYGNCEDKDVGTLYELPLHLASMKPYARRYCLYGLKAAFTDHETTGFMQGTEKLKTLIANKLFNAVVYSVPYPKAPYTPTILSGVDLEIDINQVMLDAGFAKRWFFQGQNNSHQEKKGRGNAALLSEVSKGLLPNPAVGFQSNRNAAHPAGSGDPPPSMFNAGQFAGIKNVAAGVDFTKPPPLMSPELAQNTKPQKQRTNTNFHPMPREESTFMNADDSLMREVSRLRIRESQLEREKETLKSRLDGQNHQGGGNLSAIEADRDRKTLELSESRGQVKKLEEELTRVRKQQQENDLNKRVVALQAGVNKVKRLRLQFPTDPSVRDNIQLAIDALMNGERIFADLDVTQYVREASLLYEEAQKNIKECTDKAVLDDLINDRNAKRQELYNNIESFAESVANLPLSQRIQHLRECIKGLETTHFAFLNAGMTEMMDLSEMVDMYKSWRKNLHFGQVRAQTNMDHNSLNNALGLLRKQLSLDVTGSQERTATNEDLNMMMAKFEKDLNIEIAETDIEKTQDANFISRLLSTLMTELKQELNNIDKLHELVLSYDEAKVQLSKWLEKRPDVTELKTLRTTIKQLKSQLRHKLADKQDLEEGDESGGEDMVRVKEALGDIRGQLHTAFKAEEIMLTHVSEIADQHFPELFLQCPELGLDSVLQYQGLVKLNRSLDQYCTAVLPEVEKSGLFQAKYGDHLVVLKEFFIDESLGINKSGFLDRALKYHSVTSPHLAALEGIFFVKDRNAYTQVPHYETCLGRVNSSDVLQWSEKTKHGVIKGVVQGLQALHENDVVHGSVHPNNVFIHKADQGVLAEYDFTRTLKQRSGKSCSGSLKFAAPESLHPSDPCVTKASDMYCVGLLIGYLNNPTMQKAPTASQVSLLGIHPLLQGILQNLLGLPAERYTASELLEESYFEDNLVSQEETTLHNRSKSPAQESDKSFEQSEHHNDSVHNKDLSVDDQIAEEAAQAELPEENGDLFGDDAGPLESEEGETSQEPAQTQDLTENSQESAEINEKTKSDIEIDSETLNSIETVLTEQQKSESQASGISRLSVDDIKNLVKEYNKSKMAAKLNTGGSGVQ